MLQITLKLQLTTLLTSTVSEVSYSVVPIKLSIKFILLTIKDKIVSTLSYAPMAANRLGISLVWFSVIDSGGYYGGLDIV